MYNNSKPIFCLLSFGWILHLVLMVWVLRGSSGNYGDLGVFWSMEYTDGITRAVRVAVGGIDIRYA